MFRKQAALVLLAAASTAFGSLLVGNLTSDGCADASAFQKCQDAATEKSNSCFAKAAGSVELQEGCACETYIMNYNCYAESCWNRVWQCEYQTYILAYMLNCPTAKLPVPYFPIPDGAQDACSCNFGQIYQDVQDSLTQGAACMKKVNEGGVNALKMAACKCCEISGMQSSIWETCPDVDPNKAGLSYVSRAETLLDISFSECSPMTQINCASDFAFSLGGVSTYYAPNQFPASGTASPTNKPGSVTTPASSSVFTYTNGGDKVAYTITAAAVNGNGNGGSSGSSSGDATGSAAGAQKTGSKSDGMQMAPTYTLLVAIPLLTLLL